MDLQQVIQILKTEKECVERQDTPKCNHDCYDCDLLLPTEDVLEAYNTAIMLLSETGILEDDLR